MEHEGRCVGNRVNAYTSDMDFHGGSKLSKLTYPIKTIYSKEARVQLRKVLDDFKPDVCHLNNFNYQLTPSIILEIVKWRKETGRDCKIIFTAHDYQLVCPNHRVRRIERQIRQLTAEKAHTQGIKEKLYGDYAEEILTREDFLNYNELYSKRIEEYDRKITELEAERQNLQTAPNAYPFLDVYRKYRKLEEITRPMVVELIEKIEVYEGNRVEITFRFHDEIADLLEELHQKQMGQREVSA